MRKDTETALRDLQQNQDMRNSEVIRAALIVAGAILLVGEEIVERLERLAAALPSE